MFGLVNNLERVDPQVNERLELSLVPLARIRVGKVHERHPSLPEVVLPHASVFALDEVPIFGTLVKYFALLCNIRVDPAADL